tara:strand:- start:1389 stop:1586 length:198 start_codon:yes stop_codon:yes gene_type:complete
MAQAQLGYTPQPLKVWVFYNVKNKFIRNRNKTIDRVVYNFLLVVSISFRSQMIKFNDYLKNKLKE